MLQIPIGIYNKLRDELPADWNHYMANMVSLPCLLGSLIIYIGIAWRNSFQNYHVSIGNGKHLSLVYTAVVRESIVQLYAIPGVKP